jgi:hypothetical protein
MSAIANIVINDGLATPVAHTFAPAKTQADMALLEDRGAGVYIGFNKLAFMLKRPNGDSNVANRNLKLNVRIETPKLEVVSNSTISGIAPAATVAYRPFVEMGFVFPERCILQDRKDLLAYVKNLCSSSFMVDAVEKYELPY